MKKIYLILAAAVGMTITSCTTNDYLGEVDPNAQLANDGAIRFGYKVQGTTRAGELTGATAAEMLGGMFVVEGTKGTEGTDKPSDDVVFDNYLVGYDYNSAATSESNTNNWEYVGKQTGIKVGDKDRMTGTTWTALHGSGDDVAKTQSIKYWDYSTTQYDFIAWSTGTCEAVADAAAEGKVKVTRINTGSGLATDGFTMTVTRVEDLMNCYYTDINKVTKASGAYGKPVTLTFRNMATKVRVALYETIPGYSVKDVKFYSSDANPTAPTDLGSSSATDAVLFTMGSGNELPRSGEVLVTYPHIGTDGSAYQDYNKAKVQVTAGSSKSSTQTFGALTAQYIGKELYEETGTSTIYLGRTLPQATFAGKSKDNYYTAVFPNTNGKPLTLRVDYTLVSTDGTREEIKVYGAKAVVPATYTEWQPNYAYTYIFKISDNTNGWTSQTSGSPEGSAGLYPITFDAVVTSFVDVNAEQTTVTTVATPSITTYQQGHTKANNEYSKSQTAGKSSAVKDLYVQVMDNSGTTSTLKTDLTGEGKSLLFSVSNENASEAEVMDALQNRTNTPTGDPAAAYKADSPVGRNGITLTKNTNIANNVESVINGVDDMPITVTAGTAAKIAIGSLATGTYAYVYATTVPGGEEKVYNVANASSSDYDYYEVILDGTETPLASGTAAAGKVYFVRNVDANGDFVSYTFKQTKVGDSVAGLVEATISNKATGYTESSAGNYHFYFDVYYRNTGAYAVKVFKVVD